LARPIETLIPSSFFGLSYELRMTSLHFLSGSFCFHSVPKDEIRRESNIFGCPDERRKGGKLLKRIYQFIVIVKKTSRYSNVFFYNHLGWVFDIDA
jgi:hypothetical protein